MPILLASLGGILLRLTGSLVGRVLLALGVSVLSFTGLDASLGWLKTQALSSLTGAPAGLVSLLAFLKVGVCINIIFSAILVRAALQGAVNGTYKRWVLK